MITLSMANKKLNRAYKKIVIALAILSCITTHAQHKPLRVGVAGLTHGHVGWILNYKKPEVVEVVGIAEPDRSLAEMYSRKYGFSMDIVYSSLEEMLDKTKPDAVTAFNSIYQHLD